MNTPAPRSPRVDYGDMPKHLRPLYRLLLTNPYTGKAGSETAIARAQLQAKAGESNA